jgi:hypothetical protein
LPLVYAERKRSVAALGYSGVNSKNWKGDSWGGLCFTAVPRQSAPYPFSFKRKRACR